MILFLVRHGEAVDETVNPERPLSVRGIQEVALTGQFLKGIGAQPRAFLCSDKLRARQTAERLIEEMGLAAKAESRKGFAPKDEPGPVAEELAQMSSDLLIAGHSPFLPRLASLLVCGRADADSFRIAPGGVLRLEREGRGGWSLSLSISPAELFESI